MTHDEMIAVIQAHKEGKQIEVISKSLPKNWVSSYIPLWDFDNYNYRIKVEPITRYIYIGTHPESSITFHTSGCYAEHEDKKIYFPGKYNEKYTINGTLKLSIDPHTNELLSVEIVK